MKVHEVKIDFDEFSKIIDGRKKCEVRFNDRDYQVRDFMLIRQTNHNRNTYTGKYGLLEITDKYDTEAMKDGWVVLSIELLRHGYDHGLEFVSV
jgi:hypothetical protein